MLTATLAGAVSAPVLAKEPASCIQVPSPVLPATSASTSPNSVTGDEKILVSADSAEVIESTTTVFKGNVIIVHRGRSIRADQATYHQPSGRLNLTGNVRIETNTGDVFDSTTADLDTVNETGKLGEGRFFFTANQSQGGAEKIILHEDKSVTLQSVRFSTCPVDRESWSIYFRELTLDRKSDNGIGRHAVMRVRKVPVFYTPYLRFPLGNRRQSGLLLPEFGNSDKTGTEIAIPYYFNLAPNYDATLTARWLSQRGIRAESEFRYLGRNLSGMMEMDYLPADSVTNTSRSYGKIQHSQQLATHLTASIEAESVSDVSYFTDLGGGQLESSPTHLPRRLQINYQPRNWSIDTQLTDYQVIDTSLSTSDLPYRRVPLIGIEMNPVVTRGGITTLLAMSYGQFDHPTLESAKRVNVFPTIKYPLHRPWGFVVPAISGYFTSYQDRSAGADNSIGTAMVSFDSGLLFERNMSRLSGWRQTLEPRLYYVYSPYIDQSALPVFDTAEPEPSYDHLFRENRFTGGDRVGDENRLTLAIGSRWFDRQNRQRLHAGIGQSFYFADRVVNASLPAAAAQTVDVSETLLELSSTLTDHWYTRATWGWDSISGITRYNRQFLQYQPSSDRIMNLGYRYSENNGDSMDVSAQWTIGRKWSVYSRFQLNLVDQNNLSSYAGFRYRSCCWSVQTLASQRVDDTGQQVRAFQFQLSLTGLGAGLGDAWKLPRAQSVFFEQ